VRVLFTADTFPPRCGGSGWSAFEQARALMARGHAVTVMLPGGGGRSSYECVPLVECAIATSRWPLVRHIVNREILGRTFRARVAAALSRSHYDLVHAHHAMTGPATIAAAADRGVPSLITIRDYWPTCMWGTRMSGSARCPGCGYGRIVRCLSANSPVSAPIAPFAAPYVRRYLERQRRAVARAARVIAISQRIRSELLSFHPEDRITVIPNFVDDAALALPQRSPEAPHYATFAGKLTAAKGVLELLEALRRAPTDLPVVFIGDGPLRGRVAAEIAAGRVKGRLAGWLAREQMVECIAGSLFNIFPSRWDEPLGRVIIEAAAVGRTSVVCVAAGSGPHDILEHGVSGIFATGIDDLAAGIRRLAGNPEEALRLGEAAKRRVKEAFSASAVCPQIEAAYATAIAASPDPLRKSGMAGMQERTA